MRELNTVTPLEGVLAAGAAYLGYKVLQALYNVSPLHPLSKIPGPKLAAATYLPEFYHDVILGGRYTHAIQQMHDKYGPIVRINPNETHCCDAKFSDEIYAIGGRKRDKPTHQINGIVAKITGFTTKDHDLHKMRRTPVARFFTTAMVSQLEAEIHHLANKLCDKLLAESGKNEPFDIAMAYSCFTSDAISGYCFGESFGLLDQKGWTPNFREATLACLAPVFYFRFFPFLKVLPDIAGIFVDYLPTDIALLVNTLNVTVPGHVSKTKADIAAGIQYERPTIIGSLFQSELPAHEKSNDRLAGEAVAVISAGTETTSWAMAVITFHLLDKPELLEKLTKELSGIVEDPLKLPSWAVLDKLPYLNAVIQEGIRLSYGVSGRTAREPMQEDLIYQGEFNKKPITLVLPRGYAIGMSTPISHHDESLFPDSHAFKPERWLVSPQEKKIAEMGMLGFSKGSRGCPGKILALCELNVALAAVVLRVLPKMKLYETTERDVKYDHDMFVPVVVPESKGVRVLIE